MSNLDPLHDVLEQLYAEVEQPLALCVQVAGAREAGLRLAAELHRRGWAELHEKVGESTAPLPLWKWNALHREPDPALESRIWLRRTEAGDEEWGRFYHEDLKF